MVKDITYKAPHYVIVSNLLLLHLLTSNHSSQRPVLRHLNLCFSLTVRDQDSHIYKTIRKFTLKMKAVRSSETFVYCHSSTRRHNAEHHNLKVKLRVIYFKRQTGKQKILN